MLLEFFPLDSFKQLVITCKTFKQKLLEQKATHKMKPYCLKILRNNRWKHSDLFTIVYM